MSLSYWEIKTWFSNVDYTIVGSGIVGLSCAIQLKYKYPKANVLVLERGVLPQGASTKNAGFACFGSLSEILDDLKTHTEEEVFKIVKKRKEGLDLLRRNLSDSNIDYKQFGGFELFNCDDDELFEECLSHRETINKLLKPIFKESVYSIKSNIFEFQNIKPKYLLNQFEGQIDTGKMMQALLSKAQSNGIRILNSITVEDFVGTNTHVEIITNYFNFKTNKLCITTNGFAKQLLDEEVKPARAQVLITKPIDKLLIKGTFHLDRGYYYFRNIDNRVLFGGGRNLDFKGEETTDMIETKRIQDKLEDLLKTVILPDKPFEVDYRWSGIMGIGNQKKPIVKQVSNHVYCGVRLGGMGVAIGSSVGVDLANLLD
ncbi:NAD(P)/FAD-dependent oxidoreductase [Hanstruepera ponticola]|uniref:NAD(P)/FAD-dependent oxidoreductase n=1 Tax=Hanstruepera ponticola TaxID=2042995 RepID=UPI000CF193F9|nr:FAD-dependent oxidoreductase [Hanstruepera ponticola]